MHAPHVDPLNRRRATAALVALPWLWTGARAQPTVRHRLTPAQTEGPFYPVALPADSDADLLRNGARPYAQGTPARVEGRVLKVQYCSKTLENDGMSQTVI